MSLDSADRELLYGLGVQLLRDLSQFTVITFLYGAFVVLFYNCTSAILCVNQLRYPNAVWLISAAIELSNVVQSGLYHDL